MVQPSTNSFCIFKYQLVFVVCTFTIFIDISVYFVEVSPICNDNGRLLDKLNWLSVYYGTITRAFSDTKCFSLDTITFITDEAINLSEDHEVEAVWLISSRLMTNQIVLVDNRLLSPLCYLVKHMWLITLWLRSLQSGGDF